MSTQRSVLEARNRMAEDPAGGSHSGTTKIKYRRNRVNVGTHFDRWEIARQICGLTKMKFVKHLLDIHEVSCMTYKPTFERKRICIRRSFEKCEEARLRCGMPLRFFIEHLLEIHDSHCDNGKTNTVRVNAEEKTKSSLHVSKVSKGNNKSIFGDPKTTVEASRKPTKYIQQIFLKIPFNSSAEGTGMTSESEVESNNESDTDTVSEIAQSTEDTEMFKKEVDEWKVEMNTSSSESVGNEPCEASGETIQKIFNEPASTITSNVDTNDFEKNIADWIKMENDVSGCESAGQSSGETTQNTIKKTAFTITSTLENGIKKIVLKKDIKVEKDTSSCKSVGNKPCEASGETSQNIFRNTASAIGVKDHVDKQERKNKSNRRQSTSVKKQFSCRHCTFQTKSRNILLLHVKQYGVSSDLSHYSYLKWTKTRGLRVRNKNSIYLKKGKREPCSKMCSKMSENAQTYSCKVITCMFKTKSRNDFLLHAKEHVYSCRYCHFQTRNNKSFFLHMKRHRLSNVDHKYPTEKHPSASKYNKGITVKCPMENCTFKSTNYYYLVKHAKQEHDFLIHHIKCIKEKMMPRKCCTLCSYSTFNQTHVNRHYYEKHKLEEYKPKHLCSICNHGFYTEKGKVAHEKKGCFICPYGCGRFDKYLSGHMRTVHFGKSYLCSYCGKTFKNNTCLKKHIEAKHQEGKNYKCTHEGCGKEFGRKSSLEQHSFIHDKTKRLICPVPYCDYRCNQRNSMNWHKKKHSEGEQEYFVKK